MMMLTKVNPHPDEAYTNAADAAIITALATAKAIFGKKTDKKSKNSRFELLF